MGQLSFLLPGDLSPAARVCLQSAAMLGGYDLTPIPTTQTVDGDRLVIDRDTADSGHITCPWPVPGQGTPVLMSTTLRERPEPYSFLVELVRGKVNQVRTQVAEWESAGLEITTEEAAQSRAITKAFGEIALRAVDGEPVNQVDDLLADAYQFGERMTGRFNALLMSSRIEDSGPPTTRLGASVSSVPGPEATAAYKKAFNAVRLVPSWKSIEPTEARCVWDEFDAVVDWAEDAGLAISIGPLIDLTAGSCPDWLAQWDGDLPSLAAFVCDFVETIISRYRERVNDWQIFAGLNHRDVMNLTEDDRLRLAARLLESARQSAPEALLGMSIALPWGDYLVTDEYTYSPLVFADTLLRGGFSIATVELELLTGHGPRASLPRSVLDTYRLLDLFALLGVPLELRLGRETDEASEPAAPKCSPGWVSGVLDLGVSVQQVEAIYWAAWSTAGGDADAVSSYDLWRGNAPAMGEFQQFVDLRERLSSSP